MALENKLGITDSAELPERRKESARKRRHGCLKTADLMSLMRVHLLLSRRFIECCLTKYMILPVC